MADSVNVVLDMTLWEVPEMGRGLPWEWEVRANGRSTEGRCRTREEAIDRLVRQVEQEVRSARS